MNVRNPWPDESATFERIHGASRNLVQMTVARISLPLRPVDGPLLLIGIVQLVLATLLAWRRWNVPEARALIVYFAASSVGTAAPGYTMLTHGWLRALQPLITFTWFGLGSAALIWFAAVYPGTAASSTFRRTVAFAGPLIAIIFGVVYVASLFSAIVFAGPLWITPQASRWFLLISQNVLPALGFVAGLFATKGVDRKRIAILLLFFVLGEIGPLTLDYFYISGQRAYQLTLASPLLTTLLILDFGFVYMIFRHRLFDISFVLNRTAVYAAISTLLLPLLLLGEWIAERFLTGGSRTENALVQVGIALLLFVAARQMYDRIDRFVDRLLFRERHENEDALRNFARHVRLLDDERAIGDQTVQTVCAHTDASWIALYRRDQNGDYVLTSRQGDYALTPAQGDTQLPSLVGRNDPAVLALRADGKVVDNLRASVIREALVLPAIGARGLGEFLACGPKRSGEAYAPDERDALLQLAHGVAVAFDAVRLNELETIVRTRLQPAT